MDSLRLLLESEQCDVEEAISIARELLFLALNALYYYRTYDWAFLISIVSVGYIGWILFVFIALLSTYVVGRPLEFVPKVMHA